VALAIKYSHSMVLALKRLDTPGLLYPVLCKALAILVVCLQGRFCETKFTVLHRHPSGRAFPVFPNRYVVIQNGVPTSQSV